MLKHEFQSKIRTLEQIVLTRFIKEYIDWAERTFIGRMFQASGPATEKSMSAIIKGIPLHGMLLLIRITLRIAS